MNVGGVDDSSISTPSDPSSSEANTSSGCSTTVLVFWRTPIRPLEMEAKEILRTVREDWAGAVELSSGSTVLKPPRDLLVEPLLDVVERARFFCPCGIRLGSRSVEMVERNTKVWSEVGTGGAAGGENAGFKLCLRRLNHGHRPTNSIASLHYDMDW